MPDVDVKGYQCARCKYIWVPRIKTQRPVICPHCKSPYWDRPKERKTRAA
jgi:DNA-directed RNA polymerase subunit RPC12/RpoP